MSNTRSILNPRSWRVPASGSRQQQHDRQHRRRVQGLETREKQFFRRTWLEAIERSHDAGILAETWDKLLHGGRRATAKDVLAEAVEKLVGSHHLSEFHCQPVHEEPVGAGALLPALPYLLEPVVVGLEGRLPMVVVERLCRGVITFGLQEDGVLDQVKSAEARAASVERLEDDLSVVTFVEVDGNDIQEAVKAGLKRLDALVPAVGVSFSLVGDPLLNPVVEVSPSAGDASPIRRRTVIHDAQKGFAVAPRRPDLEAQVALSCTPAVEDQLGKFLGHVGCPTLLCDLGRGREDDLQCRQTLLSVDDKARVHASGLDGLLVEDDGSEKVAVTDMGSRICDVTLGRISNVLPEDAPIFGLIPDVGPLVDGDDELDAAVEEVEDGLGGGLLHSVEE